MLISAMGETRTLQIPGGSLEQRAPRIWQRWPPSLYFLTKEVEYPPEDGEPRPEDSSAGFFRRGHLDS